VELELSDEQKQLQDEVRRLLDEKASPDVLRRLITEDAGIDRGLWAQVAELGLLASRFGAESRDGFSGRDECRTCPT